jgi:archaellum component FlaF (FlaF/FlaG flagellin family)
MFRISDEFKIGLSGIAYGYAEFVGKEEYIDYQEYIVSGSYEKNTNLNLGIRMDYTVYLNSNSATKVGLNFAYRQNIGSRISKFNYDYTITGQPAEGNFGEFTGSYLSYGLILKPGFEIKRNRRVKSKTKREKIPELAREIKESQRVKVSNSRVTLELWDNGEKVDNDMVKVLIDGEVVIESLSLTKTPYVYELTIPENTKQEIIVVALNEGKYPPNTIAIKVIDGNETTILELKSSLNSNAQLIIDRK